MHIGVYNLLSSCSGYAGNSRHYRPISRFLAHVTANI